MGISAQGSLLQVGDGASTEAFTTIPGVRNIDWPGTASPEIDVTDHDSTTQEYVTGLSDPGSLTFEINFDPAGTLHQQLYDDWQAGTERNYQVVFSDAASTKRRATCRVSQFGHSNPTNAALTASVTLRVATGDTFPAA